MEDLKSCPFCGGKSSANIYREHDGKKFWDIRCNNTDCNFIVECKGGYLTRGLAEEAWNTRAESAELLTLQDRYNAQEKKLEKAKEALEYLLEAKQEKDTVSKTEKYLSLKTIGWDKAREVMAKLKAEEA